MIRRALPAALVVATAFAAGGAAAGPRGGACTPGADWGRARQELAPAVLALVNADRATLGLPALRTSRTLTASAVWKARHMARYGYMSHDDPTPPLARTATDRIHSCGYASAYLGENIAAGFPTPRSAMAAWLQSPGHRANIERSEFRAIGIGVATSASGVTYWAQDFGSTVEASAMGLAARPDVRHVSGNRRLVIRVLGNDRRPQGRVVTIRIVSGPRHGVVVLNGNQTVTYRPSRGFVGKDRFRYAIGDDVGETSTTTVSLRVRSR